MEKNSFQAEVVRRAPKEARAAVPVLADGGAGRQDIEEVSPGTNRPPEMTTMENFYRGNTGRGKLRVQTFVGDRVMPLPDAQVNVYKEFADAIETFYSLRTDANGVAEDMFLPAPQASRSLSVSLGQPYATYNIKVSHPNFLTQEFRDTAIFDNIVSLQIVKMVPRAQEE